MNSFNFGSVAICVAALLSAAPAIAGVGKFQFVTGDVRLVGKAGAQRLAVKGLAVEEGDTIASGQPAMAQVRMNDGGILVIRPNTRLIVKAFQFSGKEDGTERAHFRLEKGGVRAVTGEIGKTNKQNYLIQTPSASIGVRGTDHEPFAVEPSDAAQGIAPGTYDKVNVGATVVENAHGFIVVNPGEVGYAANATTAPVILPEVPALYSNSAGAVPVAKRGSQASRASRSGASDGSGGDSAASVTQPLKTADGLNLSAAPPAAEPPPPPPPVTNSLMTPVVFSVVTVGEHASLAARVDGTRTFTIASNAVVSDAPNNPQPHNVVWGRWESGFSLPGGTVVGAAHFAHSPEVLSMDQVSELNFLRTAEYRVIGATRPTNELGAVGTLNKLEIGVNFSTQRVTSYSLEVTMPATIAAAPDSKWHASGDGTLADLIGPGMALEVSCKHCRAPNEVTDGIGNTRGAFVGTAAEALLNAYGLQVDGHTVSGVAALQRGER
jgi:hypothetical protein